MAPDLKAAVASKEGAVYGIYRAPKGDKVTPESHFLREDRDEFLQKKRGDKKSFPTESFGVELGKNESLIGRVWANGGEETEADPAGNAQFARCALAKEFNISKITAIKDGDGVLEIGFGPTS